VARFQNWGRRKKKFFATLQRGESQGTENHISIRRRTDTVAEKSQGKCSSQQSVDVPSILVMIARCFLKVGSW